MQSISIWNGTANSRLICRSESLSMNFFVRKNVMIFHLLLTGSETSLVWNKHFICFVFKETVCQFYKILNICILYQDQESENCYLSIVTVNEHKKFLNMVRPRGLTHRLWTAQARPNFDVSGQNLKISLINFVKLRNSPFK